MRKYASDAGQAWTLKDLQSNAQGRAILQDFLAIPTILQAHLFSSSESTYSQTFRETLIFISTVLETSWSRTEVHERYDFLFFSVTYMACTLLSSSEAILQFLPIELLRSMARYESSIDKALWQATFTGNYSIGDWATRLTQMGTTKANDMQGTRRPLVQQSPSAEVLMTLPPIDVSDSLQNTGEPTSLITPISPFVLRSESANTFIVDSNAKTNTSTARSVENAGSLSQETQVDDRTAAEDVTDHTLANITPSESTSRFVEQSDETANTQLSDTRVDQSQSYNSQTGLSEETTQQSMTVDHYGQDWRTQAQNTSNDDAGFESSLTQRYNFNSGNQELGLSERSEGFRSDLAQRSEYNTQNQQHTFSSTSEQFDSNLTQQTDYNTTQRTDMTFNNLRSNWQDARFNSFTSSQYDTNRNSMWMNQTYNRGESWSSRTMMDQSVRSSQAVDERHDGVDGNLFY